MSSTSSPAKEEQLLSLREGAKRLIVSVVKMNELIDAGEITEVITPNGRRKVVESSVNAYIHRLAKGN